MARRDRDAQAGRPRGLNSLAAAIAAAVPALLAVDLGLRTGFAAYARDGRLVWARSQNLGTRGRLKAAAATFLGDLDGLERITLNAAASARKFRVFYPELEFCTDNGAMIAFAGAMRLQINPNAATRDYGFNVRPRWPLDEIKTV